MEGGGDGGEVAVLDLPQFDLAPCRSRSCQICSCHNPVRHDGVADVMGGLTALDADGRAARSLHLAPHAAQKRLKVRDFRLPGGIDQHRFALCAAGG